VRHAFNISLGVIFLSSYIGFNLMVEVLFTDEFEAWWDSLEVEEQESVAHVVNILREKGATLQFPYCSGNLFQQTFPHARTAHST
jgi:hypothetical protein